MLDRIDRVQVLVADRVLGAQVGGLGREVQVVAEDRGGVGTDAHESGMA